MPFVSEILIAESPTSPMSSRSEVRAIPGRGIEGDRYFTGAGTFSPHPQKPDFEITLIEREKIDAFARETGLPFTAARARRNLVTEGVDLNSLIGVEFEVQGVRFLGTQESAPCHWMDTAFAPGAEEALKGRGGLRAKILSDGVLRVDG